MDPPTLINSLNALLRALSLPFVLQSPVDLTPSLLLAILESVLGVRIPVDNKSHIQTTKVFLGVLETDFLQTDVGLSKIDPRLLAAGAWDEVVYVAEVLCWIGEELGLISAPEKQPTTAPSPSSTITFLPPFTDVSPPPTPTTTTLLFSTDDTARTTLAPSSPLRQRPPRDTQPAPDTPTSSRRISTRPPSLSIPADDSSFTRQTPPIRRTGYISLVDHESELSSFLAHSLSLTSPHRQRQSPPKFSSTTPHTPPRPHPKSTPSTRHSISTGSHDPQDWRNLLSQSPDYDPRRTYHLLHQRMELMEELLHIRMSQRPSSS
ncbi:hypothetical protein P691DRAFT_774940 [Macrolepiota fuliginosa MF-IS2]|uniref:DUF5745 domain-containing protein n=1 Tax=Macrolepiota fuliginosa MF-IS2 TaxID=1400762 RepID=A0A9P5XGD2_9AGAR|nr:hypothetical protein P691DRAFT_774940 [Macrolepiota fuliginosa MF-IS2]